MRSYLEVAEYFQDVSQVTNIATNLRSITSDPLVSNDTPPSIPFLYLDGSSGLGKTQMAFNLFKNFTAEFLSERDRRKVFYFVTLQGTPNPNDVHQLIYSNFKKSSNLLIRALEFDLMSDADETSPTTGILFDSSLWIFGLIRLMISLYQQSNINENHNSQVNRNFKKCTGKDIIALLVELKIQNSRPVIIVDEIIQAQDDNNKKKLRRLQNIFKCLGFGLILLGTDSTAINIASSFSSHSRISYKAEWCFVYGNFPATHIMLQGHELIPNYIQSIFQSSRPLFSSEACAKYIQILNTDSQRNPIDILNEVLAKTFDQLSINKKIFINKFGKLGQIRLFLNASYTCLENESNAYIHSHFAYLNGDKDFIIDCMGQVNSQPFRPSSVFPSAQEDALLYLIFMGGKDHSAFMENGKVVPALYYFNQENASSIVKESALHFKNAKQKSGDGQYLEALLSTIGILSSHISGLSGVLLHDYLLDIAYQIQQVAIQRKPNHVLVNFKKLLFLGAQYRLPYFLPPNLARPDFLSPEIFLGSNINTLSRSCNADRIDISTDVGLSGECKDWGCPIPHKQMKYIIERIPEKSSLHIIFVRSLQNSYLKMNKFLRALSAQAKSRRCVYYKIESYETATLNPVLGLPSDAVEGITDCAVIFYVVVK